MQGKNYNFDDMTGKRYERLTVIDLSHREKGVIVWNCICDCGQKKKVRAGNLRSGSTRSCGCLLVEKRKIGKHHCAGKYTTPEYRAWSAMKSRCSNQKFDTYNRYVKRGIKVCERWNDFQNFYADMGARPSPQHSLDRINNDGDYEPGNCRWASSVEQQRNKSSNRIIFYNGLSLSISEWAEKFNIRCDTLTWRIKKGWSLNDALTKPVRRMNCS